MNIGCGHSSHPAYSHPSHEPSPRSGVSVERRNSWELQPAALCRDAATPGFMASIHVRILEVFPFHETRSRRRESAHSFAYEAKDWRRLTSAATVRHAN